MSKHTPGPWDIYWYECKMDSEDVEHAKKEGNLTAKVGDVLWRSPRRIGPCEIEHSHWGGNLLTVDEADARLIAAAPDLLEALKLIASTDPVDAALDPQRAIRVARAAIAAAEGEKR